MSRFRLRIMVAAVGALLALWLVFSVGASKPSWQGKTVYQWLELFDGQAKNAAEAFRQMGPETLPYLKAELCACDPAWKKQLVNLAKKQSLVEVRFTPDTRRRDRAIRACAALGSEAKPLIPALVQALGYGSGGAIPVLESFGPEAIPGLAEALTNAPGCGPPYGVALVLGRMGKKARSAITNLVWEFENYQVLYPRSASALALRSICGEIIGEEGNADSPDVAYAKRALLSGLTNTLWAVRRASAEALVSYGPYAAEATPDLVKLLLDPRKEVRHSATNALQAVASAISWSPATLPHNQ